MDFKLRPLSLSDVKDLAKYANNPKIAANMTNRFPHPYTEEHAKNFIEIANKENPPNILGIEINHEIVGAMGIHPQGDVHCKNAELGYWIAEPFWNKGIISKAIPKMVDYAFKNWNINRIFARPFGHNTASQKVLEKNGFKLEAKIENTIFKNGEFTDELIYAIRKFE